MEIAVKSSLGLYHRMEEIEAGAEELRYASTAADSNAHKLAAIVGEQDQKLTSLSQATDEIQQQVRPTIPRAVKHLASHFFCLGYELFPVSAL